MPDYGGAYAWFKPFDDGKTQVGGNCADTFGGVEDSWGGDHPISKALADDLARWQLVFEHTKPLDPLPVGGWASFHERGLSLARRLKADLGSAARVRYRWPCEDPGREADRWFD